MEKYSLYISRAVENNEYVMEMYLWGLWVCTWIVNT